MNYLRIYNTIIDRAMSRESLDIFEIHHVTPRCMGGTDDPDNLCKLTPKEHYIAHALLCKIYPDHRGIAFAFHMMNISSSNHEYRYTSKLYDYLKRELQTRPMSESHRQAISKAHKGKVKSKEHIEKIRQSNIGRKASDETRSKMSLSGSSRVRPKEEYDSRRGRKQSDSYKDHMKEKMKGKHSGKKKYNDGTKEYLVFPENADPSWIKGRLKKASKNIPF
jgi:hypothetical protein